MPLATRVEQASFQGTFPQHRGNIYGFSQVGVLASLPALSLDVLYPDDEARLFDKVTVAETASIVSARHGLKVKPDYTIKGHPPLDILVVPGGRGTRKEMQNEALLA